MKVLLIADVLANLPALDAALRRAESAGAAEVWHAGDAVGRGPYPEEVVRRLRAEEVRAVVGNLDLKVLKVPRKRDRWRESKDPRQWRALEWTWERLSPASRKWLAALPRERRLRIDGHRVLIVHASPGSLKEPLTEATPETRLRAWAARAEADLVLGGHAPAPCRRELDGVVFINAGSLGRLGGADPRACCAILDFTANGVGVQIERLEYDSDRTREALRRQALPESDDAPGAPPPPAPEPDPGVVAALALARACGHDEAHTLQVTRLALGLFDSLRSRHGLGAEARRWLQIGALLHDIGWCEGPRGHHKTTQRIVLESPALPFAARERAIVAAIARYHRGALPDAGHEGFAGLDAAAQQVVRATAAILRVADALDFAHRGLVREIACTVDDARIALECAVTAPLDGELPRVAAKADLWRAVFGAAPEVSWILR
ncbi:MAG: metallophosphoesterase family protein [Candidatus Krumholzibacteriia bacterium]